jgi:hypothetical protein
MHFVHQAMFLKHPTRKATETMSQKSFSTAQKRVWCLPDELRAGLLLDDSAVVAEVEDFNALLKTNCETAAEWLFAAVAPICLLRPQLVRLLLRMPLRPLVFLGVEQAQQVQEFVGGFVAQTPNYLPLTEEGRHWLSELLPQHQVLVQQLLNELIQEAGQDD